MNITYKYLVHNFLHAFLRQDPPYLQNRNPPSTYIGAVKSPGAKGRTLKASVTKHPFPVPQVLNYEQRTAPCSRTCRKNHVFSSSGRRVWCIYPMQLQSLTVSRFWSSNYIPWQFSPRIREMKSWFRSFFGKTFYIELSSSLCLGAYFESWMCILGPLICIFHTSREILR